MLALSMSTGEIPGARPLWRAQTNPYAAKNLVRARLAGNADTPLSTLLTPLATTGRGFTLRASVPWCLSLPSVSICVHLWLLPLCGGKSAFVIGQSSSALTNQ